MGGVLIYRCLHIHPYTPTGFVKELSGHFCLIKAIDLPEIQLGNWDFDKVVLFKCVSLPYTLNVAKMCQEAKYIYMKTVGKILPVFLLL